MGRVLTNSTNISYSIETSVGVASTAWFLLEPNSIGKFGPSIDTVVRTPISRTRQRRKGTTTDLNSAVEVEADITMSAVMDFLEGYMFSAATNSILHIPVTSVDGTANSFTVGALSASQAGGLLYVAGQYSTLVFARGFSSTAINGLHALGADPATSDVAIGVTTDIAAEASPAATARLELAGVRFLDGASDITASYSSVSKRLTLTAGAGATGFSWITAGLTVGQAVYIGSPNGSGGVTNALRNVADHDSFGYGRVISMTATVLVLDKLSAGLQKGALTALTTLDILFGRFLRNVSVEDASYLERTFQFEQSYPGLADGGGAMYRYALGNFCDTVTFNLPLSSKATATFAFIGTDTENPVAAGSRKTGASAAKSPLQTSAFNTTADIARLRILELDEDGLTTDFKSTEITLKNNVSPEKVLGILGARYMNAGIFEVDMKCQLIFTNASVVSKIRDNETVSMDFVLKNSDGALYVDLPSLTLGGGDAEFPVNESVLINVTGQVFEDTTLGYSLGVSVFPIVP